ncbi:MAG: hypothetical protein H7039_12425 [Bryobacteraceae bacterium]|nr:hypothetical protein [Bryobacteraceae bacterium]
MIASRDFMPPEASVEMTATVYGLRNWTVRSSTAPQSPDWLGVTADSSDNLVGTFTYRTKVANTGPARSANIFLEGDQPSGGAPVVLEVRQSASVCAAGHTCAFGQYASVERNL